MRRSVRTSILAATAVSALAVALAVPAIVGNEAHADDSPGRSVGGDTPQSMPLELIYGAVGRVPPLEPPKALEVPGFGTFGLGENYQIMVQQNYQEAQRMFLGWLQSLQQANSRINQIFPDSNVQLSEPGDPLFSNWSFEGGSETVESGGRNSSTSPGDGLTYNVRQNGNGSIGANYTARATVQGSETTVRGNATFEANGLGLSRFTGSMGIQSNFTLVPEGLDLKLDGHVDVYGAGTFGVSLGSTSFGVGMVGMAGDGHQVGVSVAVGADGELLGMSVGGVVDIPGFPVPAQVRIDINNTGAKFTTSPAPGVSVTSNTDGSFQMNVDVNIFYPWFSGVVSGD
jgi:hypothetical protein